MKISKVLKKVFYLCSVINSSGDSSQETKGDRDTEGQQWKNLRKIPKSKDVLLENKAKIIHTHKWPLLCVWMQKLDNENDWQEKYDLFEVWRWRRSLLVPWNPERQVGSTTN